MLGAVERLCLAELKQSGQFGQLGDFISLDYMTVTVDVAGTLDYDWAESGGTPQHKSSPFSVILPIASVANDAECGEGGEIIPVNHDPFMLRLDESDYRIAIPFAGDITPGFTARWRIELQGVSGLDAAGMVQVETRIGPYGVTCTTGYVDSDLYSDALALWTADGKRLVYLAGLDVGNIGGRGQSIAQIYSISLVRETEDSQKGIDSEEEAQKAGYRKAKNCP